MTPGQADAFDAGAIVRLGDDANGDLRLVEGRAEIGGRSTALFRRSVDPGAAGYPATITLERPANGDLAICALNKDGWSTGVWSAPGPLSGRAVALLGDWGAYVGDALHFDAGAVRRVVSVFSYGPAPRFSEFRANAFAPIRFVRDATGEIADCVWPMQIAWLDAPVAPAHVASGAVKRVGEDVGDEAALAIAPRQGDGWRRGVLTTGPDAYRRVSLTAAQAVEPGATLRFKTSGARRVGSIAASPAMEDVWEATLDAPISADRDGAPNIARPETTREALDPAWLRPSEAQPKLRSPLLATLYPTSAIATTPLSPTAKAAVTEQERPRVLFATLVPPLPANQGNRTVTRNFIRHLVRLGFDVDIVLIGAGRALDYWSDFGDRVRVFPTPFPDWEATPTATLRRELRDKLNAASEDDEALKKAAITYHPYFIVPDAAVAVAASLFRRRRYHSLVCNYTSTLRIAEELARMGPLPPTAVITHDALSRLSDSHDGAPVDLMYRYCTPEMERDTLNAVDGAVVLAISESEARYFRALGVRNPIVLCEYDAYEEAHPFQLDDSAFDTRAFVFHASANPMNVAALDWFVRNCWATIRDALPDATLKLCGRICQTWTGADPSVRLEGELTRGDLLKALSRSAIAINPTVVGTGLKIKTVEAASLGLPSVCLPDAIEGLESVAGAICAPTQNAEDFAAACIRLASDRSAWRAMRDSALAVAESRFSEAAVYAEIDRMMGWRDGVETRRSTDRPSVAAFAAPPVDPETHALAERLDAAGAGDLATELRARAGSTDAALALGDVAVTLDAAAERLAQNREDTEAWRLAAACFRAVGDAAASNEAIEMARLAAPLDASFDDAIDPSAKAPYAPLRRLPLDVAVAPSDLETLGKKFGLGWARVERYGVWSDSPFAFLHLGLEDAALAHDDQLMLDLEMHAVAGGAANRQRVDFHVNGRFALSEALPRNGEPQVISLRAPKTGASLFAPASVTDHGPVLRLQMMIDDPAQARNAENLVSDPRTLGVFLRRLTLRRSQA